MDHTLIYDDCQIEFPLCAVQISLQILDFRFGIDGIVSLYPLIKQTVYLKSKIRYLNLKYRHRLTSIRNLVAIGSYLRPLL